MVQQTREQIIDEIEHLKGELEARRRADRPTPSSVVRAYQATLERYYARLDALEGVRRSTIAP